MATTIEHMQAETDATTGPPPASAEPHGAPAPDIPDGEDGPAPPAAPHDAAQPAALDDATLERLAAIFRADQRPPDRPTWQSALLIAMAGALLAIAGGGFFSLHSDISTLGTSLRAEIAASEGSLRAEIGGLRAEMRAEIGELRSEMIAADESLRAELREFRAEFNKVALDHTQRLARLEASSAYSGADVRHSPE